MELLIGQVIRFEGDPMAEGPAAARHLARGAVALEGGKVAAVGEAEALRAAYPGAKVTDLGRQLISAGFIDAHVHYPQTQMIASWGKRLIDWLNSYTFPTETGFADPRHAADVAALYFDLALSHGTTSMCSYCTIHPASVDAYFEEARARGMRVLGGRTCMDRNAPDGLRDTAQTAYDESAALLARWHGRDRLGYVITPRFSPTSTPEQLRALGALWAEHPDCLMQTHLSEQLDEIVWVKSLFPEARDYLDTYEAFGLLGENGVYGHAIHLEPREIVRLKEVGAALAHCPTSNTFIGSGLFDMAGMTAAGLRVGLATDTGGGSSFSMLRTMAAAYEVAQLRHHPLHPAQLWWLATQGSARALKIDGVVGNIAPGMEADLIAVDLGSTPLIAQRAVRAENFWEELFPTIMMGDDRAIAGVWIGGKRQR
ncbi:guanine deaminase [Sinirhodobacter huangdaonensis]|uniref:Guanine deaminase n=1 Tax=Paenirhodobacter huangdaonensis TaxID=2501515 RepID=A0A3S3MP81_9RHOB|nr:guanine deaminase [Sinirhodobacter huangdaonensis]RWR50793.1 guanine deaminase [Sinirhodobacter huangdaonensis]